MARAKKPAEKHCRLCGSPLTHSFVDLGATPLANSYVTSEQLSRGGERSYPLHARVCEACLLVQVDETLPPDAVFPADYAYFSSVSSSWVAHARRYAEAMIERFAPGLQASVMEVASNDGYLLRHFRDRGVPVLGIEPAANVAAAARAIGVPTEEAFFSADTAPEIVARHGQADLVAANNVLAHVPDLVGFIAGFENVLKPEGVATFEFPHLVNMIRQAQFDTIYHEHYSYLSLLVVERVLARAGLRAFDAEQLPTHGGSLRLYACHDAASHVPLARLPAIRAIEAEAGLHDLAAYDSMAPKVDAIVGEFIDFVADIHGQGRRLAAYGAAAKGNTFLNACGLTAADIVCVADRCAAKQGRFLPGSHVPVVTPEALAAAHPDDVLILPWNIAAEIAAELHPLCAGSRLWVAMPTLRTI